MYKATITKVLESQFQHQSIDETKKEQFHDFCIRKGKNSYARIVGKLTALNLQTDKKILNQISNCPKSFIYV